MKMKIKTDISRDELMSILDYDYESGIFRWRISPSARQRIGDVAGCKTKLGYVSIKINRSIYKAHRLAFLYMKGRWPNEFIDHIDRDPSNNKWANLREASCSENMANTILPDRNTSGIKNVTYHSRDEKWQVVVRVDGKAIYVGAFTDMADAELAAITAREKHHKQFTNHGK